MFNTRLQTDDYVRIETPYATVTAVRMRFPADRTFLFGIRYSYEGEENTDVRKTFYRIPPPCRIPGISLMFLSGLCSLLLLL